MVEKKIIQDTINELLDANIDQETIYTTLKDIGVNQKSQEFRNEMLVDPYLNGLKAVFGYAITCHKSQGGEWDEIFLYLDNKIHGIPKPAIYQWLYTAITRAKVRLHLVNDWFII